MPTMTTPEAEPAENSETNVDRVSSPDKKPGGDGAAVETISDAQRKQVIEQMLKEQGAAKAQVSPEAATVFEAQKSESIWKIMSNTVRGPLTVAGILAAVAVNPVVAATVLAGHQVGSRVPLLNRIYKPVSKIATGTLATARDFSIAAATAPIALPLSLVRQTYQGVRGIKTKEATTLIGKGIEHTGEAIGGVARWTAEKTPKVIGKGGEAIKWGVETAGKIIAAPFQISHSVSKNTVGKLPGGTAWGLLGTVAGAAAIGWGGAAIAGISSQAYWGAIGSGIQHGWKFVSQIPSYLGI